MIHSNNLPSKESPRLEIPLSVVKELIKIQFPQWAELEIKPVKQSGWDNRTFHLGDKMSIRMPSAERYASQVKKEQTWLPALAPQLSILIPSPLAMGQASDCYPWNWSIYRWIKGQNADSLKKEELNSFAFEIAQFLNELHQADSKGGPKPGPFQRGASPSYYDSDTRKYLTHLKGIIDTA